MKVLNYNKIRGAAKKVAMLTLAIGIFASCGKTNTREDGSTGTGYYTTSQVGSSRDWQALKAQYQCQNNGDGRIQDVTFTTTSGTYTSFTDNLTAQMGQGYTGGQEAGTYLGYNPYGDLLHVERVTQGNVVAFNVTVSLCQYKVPTQNQYGYYYESIFINGIQSATAQDLKLEVNDVLAGTVTINVSGGSYPVAFARVP